MALGAVLVLAALIGGFVLLTGGDDEDDGGGGSATEASELTERLTERELGISAFYPEDWKRTERNGIVTLESKDRCAAVSLSSPVPANLTSSLLNDSVASARRSFGKKAIFGREDRPAPVGDRPTQAAVAAVPGKGGTPVAVRLVASRGEQLGHLVQQVIRNPEACTRSGAQARAVVESIVYTR